MSWGLLAALNHSSGRFLMVIPFFPRLCAGSSQSLFEQHLKQGAEALGEYRNETNTVVVIAWVQVASVTHGIKVHILSSLSRHSTPWSEVHFWFSGVFIPSRNFDLSCAEVSKHGPTTGSRLQGNSRYQALTILLLIFRSETPRCVHQIHPRARPSLFVSPLTWTWAIYPQIW